LPCARDTSTPDTPLVRRVGDFKDEYIPEGSEFFNPAIILKLLDCPHGIDAGK